VVQTDVVVDGVAVLVGVGAGAAPGEHWLTSRPPPTMLDTHAAIVWLADRNWGQKRMAKMTTMTDAINPAVIRYSVFVWPRSRGWTDVIGDPLSAGVPALTIPRPTVRVAIGRRYYR
jgi:hypothetical protein